MALPVPLPFVGREEDLRSLQADLDRVLTRKSGYAVFLLGPLGIGKTRLVSEFLRPLSQARRFAVLQLQVTEPHWEPLAHQILRLCVPFYKTRRSKPTDPGEALRLVLARRPVVFHLDDLHVLDQGSLEQLFLRIQALVRHPILFLLTTRDHMTTRLAPLQETLPADTWRTQHLEPLNRQQVHDLLAQVLQTDPPRGFLEDLYENTRGIPFFVEEALRLSVQRNLLVRRGEAWQYHGYLAEIFAEHPSVHNLIHSRYQALSEPEKQTLKVFALLGTVAPHSVVEALKHHPRMEGLARLIAHGLLRPQEQGVAFFHPLMQRVVLQEITPSERQEILTWLVEVLMTLPRPDPFLVARLFTDFQVPPRPLWVPKIRQVLGDLAFRGAHETAERLANYVLTSSTPGTLHPRDRIRLEIFRAKLVRLSRSSAEGRRMLETLLESPELQRYPNALAEVVASLVHDALGQGDLDRAEAWLRQVEPVTAELNPRNRQTLHCLRLLLEFRQGHPERLRELEQGLSASDLEPTTGFLITTQLGKIAWEKGETATALDHFQVALEWARRSGSRLYQAQALQNIRSAAWEMGIHDLWLRTSEDLVHLAEGVTHPMIRRLAREAQAELALWQGRFDEATTLLHEIQHEAETAGHLFQSLNATLALLELYLWTDPERGYALARSFLPTFRRYPYTLPDVYAYLAFYAFALNRWAEGYSHLRGLETEHLELSEKERRMLEFLHHLYQVWEGEWLPQDLERWAEEALARFPFPWKLWVFAGLLLRIPRWFEQGAEALLSHVGRARVKALAVTLQAYKASEEFHRTLQRILARESDYRMYLFGEFTVLHRGRPVDVGFQKERTLLALLLVERRALARDEAMEWLWPEANPDRVRGAFHNVLSKLRQALGEIVHFTEHTLALHWDRIWVDLWEFGDALKQGLEAREQGDAARARQWFLRALTVARRGRFLANLSHPVLEEEMDTRVVPPLVAALDWLAEQALAQGKPLEALEYAREIRRWNASDERGILRTLEALLALGDQAQARKVLQGFVESEFFAGFSPQGMERLKRLGLLSLVSL